MTETALEKRVLGLVYAARPEVMASLVKRCEQAGARAVALGPTALSSALPDDARFAILMDPPESLKARMRPPMTLLLLKGPVLNESSAEQVERFLLSVTESIEIVGPIKLDRRRRFATIDGTDEVVNGMPFRALELLVLGYDRRRHVGEILTFAEIIRVLGRAYTAAAIHGWMDKIRRLLGPYRDMIENVSSVGYRLRWPVTLARARRHTSGTKRHRNASEPPSARGRLKEKKK